MIIGLFVSFVGGVYYANGEYQKVYGKKGNYEFTFKPNGIGYSVVVYSELANFELDLTEPENF